MVQRLPFVLHFLLWSDGHRWCNTTALVGFNLRHQKCRFAYLTKALPAFFLLSLALLPACAQKEIITVTNWRVHQGDNPAWAAPDFDDSHWAEIPYLELNSFNYAAGAHWYRGTFQVPADFAGQDLAVGMGPLDEVYDVYIDGALVGRFGSWEPTPQAPFPRHIAFPIPPGLLKGPVGHIAIRRWRGGAGLNWVTFSLSGNMDFGHAPEIGSKTAIEALERLHPATGAIREMPWTLTFVFFLFAAAISFVLFSVQRRRVEYLYLGAYYILWGAPPLVGIPLAISTSVMGQSWAPALTLSLEILTRPFSLLFLSCLCPRFRRVLQIGAILAAVFAFAAGYSLAGQSHAVTLFFRYGVSYGSAVFYIIAAWGLFQDRSRGSFAIASSLLLNEAVWGWSVAALSPRLPRLAFDAGPFRIDVRSVSLALFGFVTLLVLYLRTATNRPARPLSTRTWPRRAECRNCCWQAARRSPRALLWMLCTGPRARWAGTSTARYFSTTAHYSSSWAT